MPTNATEGAHTIYFTDFDSRYFLVATFTVGAGAARRCFDAYFIGVHGSIEGPDDTNRNLPYSAIIVETLNSFYKLAREKGKVINTELISYHAPSWEGPLGILDDISKLLFYKNAGRDKLNDRIRAVVRMCPTQSIVLAGYSFGAWVIHDWLSQPQNRDLLQQITAVVLYGDPLWSRDGYGGLVRRVWAVPGMSVTPDPYENDAWGPEVLQDRMQSRCLHLDPICGEGWNAWDIGNQLGMAGYCIENLCEHHKYALHPESNIMLSGYGLTANGANFLAMKAFPEETPGPEIVHSETFREGPLVFFRLYYADPHNEVNGFGFVGVNGSGWAEESHWFVSPSYGRVFLEKPGRLEYPFNHLCGTGSQYESDVEAWVVVRNPDGSIRDGTPGVEIHMTCSAPSEVVTPFPCEHFPCFPGGIAR